MVYPRPEPGFGGEEGLPEGPSIMDKAMDAYYAIVDKLKELYFKGEDKYYETLDRINPKVPVYKVIDPIDRVVPSFALLLGMSSLLIIFILMGIIGSFISPAEFDSAFIVSGKGEMPLAGIQLLVGQAGLVETVTTDAAGKFVLRARANEKVIVETKQQGYKEYTREFFPVYGQDNYVNLKPISAEELALQASPAAQKIIEIWDGSSGLLKQAAYASFSCSTGIPSPGKQQASNGIITVVAPEGCGVMSATAESFGFDPKNQMLKGSRTVIKLTRRESAKGIASITVVDSNSNSPIKGIQVSILDVYGNPLDSDRSDSTGRAEFELSPGTYVASGYDSAGTYMSAVSSSFTVTADERSAATIRMEPTPPDAKVLKVKVVDSVSGEAVRSVAITVSLEGKAVTSAPTQSDGTATFAGVEEKDHSLVLRKNGYLTKVVESVSPVSKASGYTEIKIEKATPQNSGAVKVLVSGYGGAPEKDAKVFLKSPDFPIISASGTTKKDGLVEFKELPLGSYYAQASKDDANGTSDTNELFAGRELALEVPLVLGKGTIKVEVDDEYGNDIENADIVFIDSISGERLLATTTSEYGKAEADFTWVRKPYLVVSKPGFFKVTTSPVEIVPGTRETVKVKLYSEIDYPYFGIYLKGVYRSNKSTLAGRLYPENAYYFRMAVVAPQEGYKNVTAEIVADSIDRATAENSYLTITNPYIDNTPLGVSAFSGMGLTDSTGEDAKRIFVNVGKMSTGVKEFFVKTYLKEVPDDACVEVPFLYSVTARKGGNEVKYPAAGRKIEGPYLFGDGCGGDDGPLCDPDDDDCQLLDMGVGICDTMESECSRSSHFEAIPFDSVRDNEFRFDEYEIVTGNPYMLEFAITNNMNDELDTTMYMEVEGGYENSITWSPDEEDIEIEEGDDDEVEFSLLAKREERSLYLYALFDDDDYPSARLEFEIEQGELMSLYIDDKNPSFLTAGKETVGLQITVKEAGSMEGVEEAEVTLCETQGSCVWGDLCDALDKGDGVYECQLPISGDYEDGTELYLRAEKELYEAANATITVIAMPEMPTEKLKCIHIEPARIPADVAEKKFTIYAYDPADPTKKCPEDVYITISPDTGTDGTLSISPLSFNTEYLLAPGESKAVTASLGAGAPGAYSAIIHGRPVSEQEKTKLKEVDIEFGSDGGQFRLVDSEGKEKYVYNIAHNVDGATVMNDSFLTKNDGEIGAWQNTNKQYLKPATRTVSFTSPGTLAGESPPIGISYESIPTEDKTAKIEFEYVLTPGDDPGDDPGVGECIVQEHKLEPGKQQIEFVAPCPGAMKIGKNETNYSGNFVVLLNSADYSYNILDQDTSEKGWVGSNREAFVNNYSVVADGRWGGDYTLEPFGQHMGSQSYFPELQDCKDNYGDAECNIDCELYYECFYGEFSNDFLKEHCLEDCPSKNDVVETMCNARLKGYWGAQYNYWLNGASSPDFKLWDEGRHYCQKFTPEPGTFAGRGRSIRIKEGEKIYAKGDNAQLTLLFTPDNLELESEGESYFGTGTICETEGQPFANIDLGTAHPGVNFQGYTAKATAVGEVAEINLGANIIEVNGVSMLRVWRKDASGQQMQQCSGTTAAVPYEVNFPMEIRNYEMEDEQSIWAVIEVNDHIAEGQGVGEDSGKFRVKLVLDEEGLAFGEDALPPVLLNWAWTKFIGSTVFDEDYRGPCDYSYEKANHPDAPYYCDATQFAMELMYKLAKIYELGQQGKNDSEFGKLKEFDVYLLGDGFSSDFREDFDSWAGAIPGFWSEYKSKWNKYLVSRSNLKLPTSWSPGLYHVTIKGTERDGYDFFGSDGEPLRNIAVKLEKVGGEYKNPLYYLAFNGGVGVNSQTGQYHRMGYGLGYTGEGVLQITPPTTTGQAATIATGPSATGSGVAELEVVEQSPFDAGPSQRPQILAFETVSTSGKPKYKATYTPSIPIPVGIGLIQDPTETEVHFFYSLMNSNEEVVPLGDMGSLWTGMGSSLGECTDFYGSPLPYKEPDSPISSAGTGLCEAGLQENAYGFSYTSLPLGNTDEVFMQSIFYLPDQTYLLKNACSSSAINGITMGKSMFSFPETHSTTLDYPALGISPKLSVSEIFGIIRNPPQEGEELRPWMGAADDGESIKMMWNEEMLYGKLMNACGESCGEACKLISTVRPYKDPNAPLSLIITVNHTGGDSRPYCPDDDARIEVSASVSGGTGNYSTEFSILEGGQWLDSVSCETGGNDKACYKYRWSNAIHWLKNETYETATVRVTAQDTQEPERVTYKDIEIKLSPEYQGYSKINVCPRPY